MSWFTAASIRVQIQQYERLLEDARNASRDLRSELVRLREAADQHQRVTDTMEANLSGCMQGLGSVSIDRNQVRSAGAFLDKLRASLSQGDAVLQGRREHWRQLRGHIQSKKDDLEASEADERRYTERVRQLRLDLLNAEAMAGAY